MEPINEDGGNLVNLNDVLESGQTQDSIEQTE